MQLPWRAAPRAALSSPLTVLVGFVAAMLLTFVSAAAVFHADATGGAAVSYQAGRLCSQTVPPVVDGMAMSVPAAQGVLAAARESGKREGFDRFVGAVYSPVGQYDFNGKHPWSRFGYRDGALDNLQVLQGGSRDGLWVPQSIAEDGNIRLGDRGLGGALPPVTAIYRDITEPVPDYWCSESRHIVPNLLATEGGTSAAIFFPSMTSFADAVSGLSRNAATVTVRFPIDALPRTVDEAAALVERGQRVAAESRAYLAREGIARNASAQTYFQRPIEVARQAESTVFAAVMPLTVISVIVGLVGVAAVAVQWCQRRRAELRLLWARGASPLALGARGVAELAAPLVAGAVVGLVGARVTLGWYAPSTDLTARTTPIAVAVAAVVLVAALAVTWLVSAYQAHREFQAGSARRRAAWAQWIPWELATAVLAYLAWAHLVATPVRLEFGKPLPQSADAIKLAFPLLVVLTVALVAVRLTRLGLRLSHRVSWWRAVAVQLALRRLAAAAGSAVGIVLVGVLAVGTLTVGIGVAGAQAEALDTKSGLFVGAERTSTQIAGKVGRDPSALPTEVTDVSTVVGELKTARGVVLVVDPETFTRAAWLGDRDADDLRAQLVALAPGTAIRVGSTPDQALELPRVGQVRPIAHLESFPLIGTARGYVVTRAAVPDLTDIDVWRLWSTMPPLELIERLNTAGIYHLNGQDRSKTLDGLPFLTVTWTFDFVTALGFVLAVVAAAALVLAVEVRRRQNALAGALATRMGLRQRTLVAVNLVELGSLAGLSVLAGGVAGWVCTAVSAPLLDPSPWLRPIAAAPDMLPLLSTTVAVTALVVGLTCWSAVRSVTTARIGELIRG